MEVFFFLVWKVKIDFMPDSVRWWSSTDLLYYWHVTSEGSSAITGLHGWLRRSFRDLPTRWTAANRTSAYGFQTCAMWWFICFYTVFSISSSYSVRLGVGRAKLHTLAGETLDVKVHVLHSHHFPFAHVTAAEAGDGGALAVAAAPSTVAGVLVGACGEKIFRKMWKILAYMFYPTLSRAQLEEHTSTRTEDLNQECVSREIMTAPKWFSCFLFIQNICGNKRNKTLEATLINMNSFPIIVRSVV